jgi:hypothetical protein
MKLLRNPVVVGILAVLAVALLFVNVVLPLIKKPARAKSRPVPVKQSEPPSKLLVKAGKQATASVRKLVLEESEAGDLTWESINMPAVWAQSARWTEAPKRDPFHNRAMQHGKSAQELLTLKAIWRQTESTLAVLNNQVVSEGEMILGFRVEKIDSDRVWLEGGNGREALRFKAAFASPPQKADPAALPETPEPAAAAELQPQFTPELEEITADQPEGLIEP